MAKNNISRYFNVRADKNTILASAKSIDNCQFGNSIIAFNGSIRLNQQKTTEKEFFTLFGYDFKQVKKITYIRNFRRYDMTKKIEATTGNTFTASKQSGATTLEGYRSVKVTDKDATLMLQCSYTLDDTSVFKTRYIIDGKRFATEEEHRFIEGHKYIAPSSHKQEEAGMSEKEQVRFLQFKFDNIVAIGKNQLVEPIWESICK